MGSLIHELGHVFDLGHSDDGFMARGFDDLDKFFNAKQEPVLKSVPTKLPRCGATKEAAAPAELLISGEAKATVGGTNYLEEYQRKKYYQKMMQECGNAFWDKSSASILSSHRFHHLPTLFKFYDLRDFLYT